MIQDLEAVGSPAPAETTGTPTPLRLRLDPNGPTEPYLDGAWWPCSHELPVELSALLAALSADLGPIALVGYHRDAWEPAPDRLDLAGHPIHLVGFGSPNPPTLIVIADTGRRVTLRVVAPETDGASAAEVMAACHSSHRRATHRRSRQQCQRRRIALAGRARCAAFPAARQRRARAGRADLQLGGRSRRPVQQRADPGIRPDPRRAHRPRTPEQNGCRSGRW